MSFVRITRHLWTVCRYVGGAPGKIDLYVGKEVVRRGIPMDGACDQLVDLIKEHGRWKEPDADEEDIEAIAEERLEKGPQLV